MGIPLVLPKGLNCKRQSCFYEDCYSLSRVDVIYRRIQDYYIDPVGFTRTAFLSLDFFFLAFVMEMLLSLMRLEVVLLVLNVYFLLVMKLFVLSF